MNGVSNEMLSMRDKVILVTGGAQGIGWGLVTAFLGQGGTVICADLKKPDDLLVTAIADQAERRRLHCYETDITVPESVEVLLATILQNFGRVDILVNNAGIIYKDLVENMDFDQWNAVLNVNLTGAMLVTKAAVPGMKKQRWGRIINTSSIQAFIGTKTYGAYAASKAGLAALTKVWATEVAEHNITVNSICPGFAHTPMADKTLERISRENGIDRNEALASLVSSVPQKRLIEPEEIAALALFLASDMAKGITGEAIILSGGLVMR
jgi:NAD(P)-dependent dehydrogenase (short-subunit alcohol dehydrogenase family)